MEDINLKESEVEAKVVDAKSFKQNRKTKKDSQIDDIIKKMVDFQRSADEGLKELTQLCLRKENDR